MPLLRNQKEKLVTELEAELKNSRIILIFAYSNLNNKLNLELRDRSFEVNGKIKMISNNLLTIVLKSLNQSLDLPQKQLALAYQFEDEVSAAKLLSEFAKKTNSLEILAGWIDGEFFTSSKIKTLATLPNKEVLLGQVVSRLSGIIQGLVYNLNYPLQKFVYVISSVEKSKNN